MSAVETLAFLHAHGLDIEPKGLNAALRAALESLEARYYPTESEAEGLTPEEIEVARSGGLEPRPAGNGTDPLVRGVVALASLIETGLTTRHAAERLGVSDARIRQRLQDRTLLAIRSGRTWKLPVFQFTERGELPGWSEVCAKLPETASPVAIERWLALPNADLVTGEAESPVSPREWLLAGRPPEPVTELASELA